MAGVEPSMDMLVHVTGPDHASAREPHSEAEACDIPESGARRLHRGRKRRRRESLAAVSAENEDGTSCPTYAAWLDHHVLRTRGFAWFSAFYVHWLMVIVLALLIIHAPETLSAIRLLATIAPPTEESLDVPLFIETVVPAEMPATETEVSPAAQVLASHGLPVDELQIADSVLNSLQSQAVPDPTAAIRRPATKTALREPRLSKPVSLMPHPLSTPPQAVVQGSFAVWTEPAYPRPGQPYRIVIQIRLPEGTLTYDLSDLQGVVVGSDGYRKPVLGSVTGPLVVTEGCVRVVVPVVSADARVRDTVFVKSRLLKESQQLTIDF